MTAAEVQRVAQKYFTPENRLVITIMPKGSNGSREQP
jgi:predicted Zn-dependent peptidase